MTWRLLTKLLRDKPMTAQQLMDALVTDTPTFDHWQREAIDMGVVERTEIGRYKITLMGIAWLENRVELRRSWPGGYAWAATWMQPLPRYAGAVA